MKPLSLYPAFACLFSAQPPAERPCKIVKLDPSLDEGKITTSS